MKMRSTFISEVLAQHGSPYRFVGKGTACPEVELRAVKWPWPVRNPRLFDCSGLITWGWELATGMRWRADHDCDKLLSKCQRVEKPRNGTLVFYGVKADPVKSVKQDAQHVVMYLDGCVVGANGGDRTTVTLETALSQSARVCFRASASYRNDFMGYYELPFPDEAIRPTPVTR